MDEWALRKAIKQCGLTVEKMLEAAGIDKTKFYRKLRDGGDKLSIGDAKKIAEVLKLSEEASMVIFWE